MASPPRSPRDGAAPPDGSAGGARPVELDPAELVRGLSDSEGDSPRRKRRRLRRGGDNDADGGASPTLSQLATGDDGESDDGRGRRWDGGDENDGVREEQVEEEDDVAEDDEADDFGEQADEVDHELDEMDIAQRERQYFSDEEDDDGEDLGENAEQ